MTGPRAVSIFLPFDRTKEKPQCSPGGCCSPFPFVSSGAAGGWTPASSSGLGLG